MKKAKKYFLIAFIVIALDQLTKLLVKFNMTLNQDISLIGDIFKLYFIENDGAAFGLTVSGLGAKLGLDISPETGKLALTLFSILAVAAIGFMLVKLSKHKSPLPFYLAIIFGGAVGNIIDRTFYGLWFEAMNDYEGGFLFGQVVDMIYIDIYNGPYPSWVPFVSENSKLFLWPIFNIADAAISIGIIVIIIFQNKFFKLHEKAIQAEEANSAAKEEPLPVDAQNP